VLFTEEEEKTPLPRVPSPNSVLKRKQHDACLKTNSTHAQQ
jgi:hypothetical protein